VRKRGGLALEQKGIGFPEEKKEEREGLDLAENKRPIEREIPLLEKNRLTHRHEGCRRTIRLGLRKRCECELTKNGDIGKGEGKGEKGRKAAGFDRLAGKKRGPDSVPRGKD